jgi:hypothetical protein
MATVLGFPPGYLATWVGSFAVSMSFFVIAFGTVIQAMESRRQVHLDESAQARLVGGSVSVVAVRDDALIEVEVITASIACP